VEAPVRKTRVLLIAEKKSLIDVCFTKPVLLKGAWNWASRHLFHMGIKWLTELIPLSSPHAASIVKKPLVKAVRVHKNICYFFSHKIGRNIPKT